MNKLSILLFISLIPMAQAVAITVEEKGLQIAQEMDKRDTGFKDQSADMMMVLKNRHGDTTKREIRSKTLEVQGDGDKTLVIFDTPADVKGTAFLSYTHAIKADDQWLFLPALKRVKRISSSNKSGPFMGSEFAYEDITSQEVAKYSYRYINEEKIDGRDTYVMERKPAYKKSGYTRQVVWVDKEYYQPVKVEFYDRKNSLLKTLKYQGYKKYLDRYWRPLTMSMLNHQTGKSTVLTWNNYKFQNGLSSRDFDRTSLKRIR